MTARTDFTDLTSVFRRKRLAYCYRMLGSVDEAEDLVRETYLRAWRSFDGFARRSSVRTWLYRIATNACLTALDADALAELLRKDATLEMPPLPGWFAGQDMIRDFLAT